MYREVRTVKRTKKHLWEAMRAAMEFFRIPDWQTMMGLLIDPDAVRSDLDPRTG